MAVCMGKLSPSVHLSLCLPGGPLALVTAPWPPRGSFPCLTTLAIPASLSPAAGKRQGAEEE